MKFKLISFSALAALALAMIGPATAADLTIGSWEQQVIDQTNAQRARYGLPALAVDMSLMQNARNHCNWMAKSTHLQHSNQNVAENIAQGQNTSGEAVNDWMNSPGHRANILNRSYTRIGVSGYMGPDGKGYWCQQFVQ